MKKICFPEIREDKGIQRAVHSFIFTIKRGNPKKHRSMEVERYDK